MEPCDGRLQFLMIVIQQDVPLVLLEDAEADALNLRPVRPAVVAFRHVHVVVVAAFVLDVLMERVVRLRFLLRLLLRALRVDCDGVGNFSRRGDVMMLLLAFRPAVVL